MEHSFNINHASQFGINCALILKEIARKQIYFQRHNKNKFDGATWVYYSRSALRDLFPYLSDDMIRTAIKKLMKQNIISEGCYNKHAYDRTKWYSVVNEAVLGEYRETPCTNMGKSPMVTPEIPNGNTGNPQPIPPLPSSTNPLKPPISPEEIYQAYPRKVGKGNAVKAIEKALRKIDCETLLAIVKRYADKISWQDKQFIPHPATWFNGERWKDDPTEWEAPASKQFMPPQDPRDAVLDRKSAQWDMENIGGLKSE